MSTATLVTTWMTVSREVLEIIAFLKRDSAIELA
jgi:hypothetical protein